MASCIYFVIYLPVLSLFDAAPEEEVKVEAASPDVHADHGRTHASLALQKPLDKSFR